MERLIKIFYYSSQDCRLFSIFNYSFSTIPVKILSISDSERILNCGSREVTMPISKSDGFNSKERTLARVETANSKVSVKLLPTWRVSPFKFAVEEEDNFFSKAF